jgi:hypothetical protein
MRVLSRSGAVLRDWRKVGKAASVVPVSLSLPMSIEPLRLEFLEPIAGVRYCLYDDIYTCWHAHADGQSQTEYALSLRLSILAGAASPYVCAWEGDAGSRCFLLAMAPSGTTLARPAIYHAEATPQILGPGIVGFLNRAARYTPYPVLLSETAVSGTTIQDQVSDDTGTDVRDMEDVYKVLRLLANRDANGKIIVSGHVECVHSSDNQTDYAGLVLKPYLWGQKNSYISDLDDWPFSGKELVTNAPFVQMPRNRHISSSATTDPATTTDNNGYQSSRYNVLNAAETIGYLVGPAIDVHTLDSNVFTHPAPDSADGAVFVAEMLAEGFAMSQGLGRYKGPVKPGAPYFRDATRMSFLVPWEGPLGLSLKTKGGVLDVKGAEVNNSVNGFYERIIDARTTEVFSTGAAFPVGTVYEYKPGGPGDYGAGFDEATWMAGTLMHDIFLVWGTNGESAVAPAA